MADSIRLGLGRHLIPIPRPIWQRVAKAGARKAPARLAFMSPDHHRVRDFSVLELPRLGAPLSPEAIAAQLGLDVPHVTSILDDLEEHLTFVFRNDRGEVTWAYPVTVDETRHHASFSTGEEAWSP
jgi:hypothetical protein